jgi:16S rRNA (guanine527-N7)-methyltransferase
MSSFAVAKKNIIASMELILKYFPNLTEKQKEQMAALKDLYTDWNAKINVISRKDIDNLYEHHVLHSLAIMKALRFKAGSNVLDFGTGGGFPGIPLAIMMPDVNFKLIDGTGKKIRVVEEVASAIGLENVTAEHLRGEDEKGKYDFVVSRAVMPLPDLVKIVKKNISQKQHNAMLNGVLVLKGGNVDAEIHPYRKSVEVSPISNWFEEEWFKEKNVIYLPL